MLECWRPPDSRSGRAGGAEAAVAPLGEGLLASTHLGRSTPWIAPWGSLRGIGIRSPMALTEGSWHANPMELTEGNRHANPTWWAGRGPKSGSLTPFDPET